MGPTAAGKTDLAMALYDALPVELISVDAAQVYRGLDIGTAKPSPSQLQAYPHRLIDIRDPADPYSAADFCQDARREMGDIVAAGRIPLLVGGTMFYFHALEFGLSQLPAADPNLRQQLETEAARIGWPAMHAHLAEVDPESARRIKPGDRQRIQRALEIHGLTGLAASELQTRENKTELPYRPIRLALYPSDRERLHAAIARRFQRMLEQGLIVEVEQLFRRGDLGPELPAIRTVGYRQIWQYLRNELSYNAMVDRALAASRQLAKRQLTWIRGYQGLKRLENLQKPPIDEAIDYLQRHLHL